MTTLELLDELCEVLGREPGTLTLADTPNTVKEWDSIGHLSMIAMVDEELDIDAEEIRSFKSIGELVDRLNGRNALDD